MEHLEAVILQFLCQQNTHNIRDAEASLRSSLSAKGGMGHLVSLLCSSTHEVVRQTAGILLRRQIVALWGRKNASGRVELQRLLLGRLAGEPSRLVRKAVIGCVSSLGKATLSGAGWPELFELLVLASTNNSEEVRELGQLLAWELAESCGGTYRVYNF